MEAWKNNCASSRSVREPFATVGPDGQAKSWLLFLLAASMLLSACGGSSSSTQSQSSSGQLAGNWQFMLAGPPDGSFVGDCPSATGTPVPLCFGGFLLVQNDGAVSGQVTYSILLPGQSGGTAPPTLCNSGSTPITGTVNGQNVTLTAVAGKQTFILTGVLSGTTMIGTYTSTDGKGCGTAQTGLQWNATSVPPLTGAIQGSFHSTVSGPLRNQVFPVTGMLTQGDNIGASNATVTGTLNFTGYPCLGSASVNGQISGSSVVLQIISSSGLNVGQIGAPVGITSPNPVTVLSSVTGEVLQGANGYGVLGTSCPGGIPDGGDVCLGLGNTTSCTQPILFSPASLIFPPQLVGSGATTQTITLSNNNLAGTPLTGLTLAFVPQALASPFSGLSDFDGVPNFTEQDNCSPTPGGTFALNPLQSCIITIAFAPQQSCPWLPSTEPPSKCPFPLQATLTVNSPASADSNTSFAIPISGTGLSAIVPSTPELDFGAEAVGEKSASQLLSFTNQGTNPVQILPALTNLCATPASTSVTLARPLTTGVISGLQVDTGNLIANGSTINYSCDVDSSTKLPNFQISGDGCSGTLLMPLESCNLMITFVPQPSTTLSPALDYFLELNTLQCTSGTTANCEIDSGRFPVELKANLPSPLRMTPSAGLNFGIQGKGTTSAPQTITLFNDPKDPMAGTITFTGSVLTGTNFAETDTCLGSLAPGGSCTFTVTFTPLGTGFESSTITIGYGVGLTQTIYLKGTGQ